MKRTGTPLNGREVPWLPLLLGMALVAAVVTAVFHLSDGREFLRLAERAEAGWFALAVVLQAAVYLPMGWIWSMASRAGGIRFPLGRAYKLSLGRVFVNQAFPSLGLGGIVLAEAVLERHGVPRPTAMAVVMVNTVSYYAAYVLAFSAALLIALAGGRAPVWAGSAVAVFAVFGAVFAWALLSLSSRNGRPLARFPRVQRILSYVREADPRLARSPFLVSAALAAQLAVLLMDAATVWVLVRSFGAAVPAAGAFAAFMFATLVRTVGFMPGGLGTFEAASVFGLKTAGVDVPAALAATLLFRGLNFWLPMAPGYLFSRRKTAGSFLKSENH